MQLRRQQQLRQLHTLQTTFASLGSHFVLASCLGAMMIFPCLALSVVALASPCLIEVPLLPRSFVRSTLVYKLRSLPHRKNSGHLELMANLTTRVYADSYTFANLVANSHYFVLQTLTRDAVYCHFDTFAKCRSQSDVRKISCVQTDAIIAESRLKPSNITREPPLQNIESEFVKIRLITVENLQLVCGFVGILWVPLAICACVSRHTRQQRRRQSSNVYFNPSCKV
jgi:hypothetical protein